LKRTLREIIDGIGLDVISNATQATGDPVSAGAVRKWRQYGIPTEHITLVQRLAKIRPADILAANDAALRDPEGRARRREMHQRRTGRGSAVASA